MKNNLLTPPFLKQSLLFAISFFSIYATTIPTYAITTAGQQYLGEKIKSQQNNLPLLTLKANPPLRITHTLRRSASGEEIKTLQEFLKAYGTYPEGMITGYYGVRTEEAVKKLQRREGLEPVGIVGPKTRAAILRISKEKVDYAAAHSRTPEITTAELASTITENGKASLSETKFASTTSDIYAVLVLKNAKQDTEISYIRLYENTYLDSQVSHPSRTGLAYFHFQWSLKQGTTRKPGTYKVSFYIDGKKSKEINFTIY